MFSWSKVLGCRVRFDHSIQLLALDYFQPSSKSGRSSVACQLPKGIVPGQKANWLPSQFSGGSLGISEVGQVALRILRSQQRSSLGCGERHEIPAHTANSLPSRVARLGRIRTPQGAVRILRMQQLTMASRIPGAVWRRGRDGLLRRSSEALDVLRKLVVDTNHSFPSFKHSA